MKRILRNERGIALAVAIFALVVVGALVAGAFFAGTQEQRVGENQRRVQTSFGVAEAGTQERVLAWSPDQMNKRPLYCNCAGGDSVVIGPNQLAANGTGRYTGYSYHVGPNLFLLDVTGQDSRSYGGSIAGGGGARSRLGMLARIAPVNFNIQASLTTQGQVNMSGNANINGTDQTPTGWTSCDPPGPPQAGVRDQGGNVSETGNAIVTGTPPVVNDPTINNNTFSQFGTTSYAQLAARATITIPAGTYTTDPVVTNGVCDKTVLTNWGDGINPLGACGSYWPIIHATGTITLNNTQGQGILLVDGDLNVQGSYQFFGIVVIQGDLKTAGGGSTDAHFWGGVMAKNADLSVQNLSGKATLNFSSCSIQMALQAQSPIGSMRSRGWVQLF